MYRAEHRYMVEMLADDIRECPSHTRAALAASINGFGLMKAPLRLRLGARLVQLRWRCSLPQAYARIYSVRHPNTRKIVDSLIEQTADWAENGRDREDKDSVGGFSQREINLLTIMLRECY